MSPSVPVSTTTQDNSDSFEKVPIAGIVRFSSVDYPGKLAAVLFTQGCPWGCAYCHNSHLQPLRGVTHITPSDLRFFLKDRRNLLDAIVVSGGEPTLHPELPNFIREIKRQGYAMGLHTNGMNPRGLENALPFCDWVGLDVKAPRKLYPAITGADAFDQVISSAKKLIKSKVDHEFRMTFHPALLSEDDIVEAAECLAELNAQKFVLQQFRAQGCSNEELCRATLTSSFAISKKLENRLTKLFPLFTVRGG